MSPNLYQAQSQVLCLGTTKSKQILEARIDCPYNAVGPHGNGIEIK